MEVTTAILSLAEIAKENGGQLPVELAQAISQHKMAQVPKGTNDTTRRLVDDIVKRALWN